MTYLPLFPLTLVVYPNEKLNLHIFEPRYRQMINECLANDTNFGIPTYLNNKIQGYGTEVKIAQLAKRYDDNRMDIRLVGVQVFEIAGITNPAAGKLYAAGDVNYIDTDAHNRQVNPELFRLVEIFYDALKINYDFLDSDDDSFSYRVGHKVGLSPKEEYLLLTIPTEAKRQDYLIKHLQRTIPVIKEIERTKDRVAMNGHFQNIDPLNF